MENEFVKIRLEWLRDQYRFLKKELMFLCELKPKNIPDESKTITDEIIELIKKQMYDVVNKGKNMLTK